MNCLGTSGYHIWWEGILVSHLYQFILRQGHSESISEPFLHRVVEKIKSMKREDPLAEGTHVGNKQKGLWNTVPWVVTLLEISSFHVTSLNYDVIKMPEVYQRTANCEVPGKDGVNSFIPLSGYLAWIISYMNLPSALWPKLNIGKRSEPALWGASLSLIRA